MKSIQKKALAAAVVATFGIGSAEAVYQNPDGTGQVLFYPYYTVQQVGGKSMNTLITVVNTTSRAKVAKVRFREGKASKEVLDFNLFLSPNDMWTAAVVPASADASSAGRLLSFDKSCTNPAIPAAGVDFRNFAYSGPVNDGLGTDLARTREGYLEIIELATLDSAAATAVTHNALGVPANCKYVQTSNGAIPDQANNLKPPTGGLAGTGTIINVAQGSDIGYNAVALADCFRAESQPTLGNETGNISGCANDSFSTVMQLDSSQRSNEKPLAVRATFTKDSIYGPTTGVDAVSSTLMAQSVINEFILDGFTKSNTDWVLTFPTRHYYHQPVTPEYQIATLGGYFVYNVRPFTNILTGDGVCEGVEITYFNREEASAVAAVSDFSPQPIKDGASVCWEANVVSFRSGAAHHPAGITSAVLGSKNTTPLTVGTFENGWAEIKFVGYNYGSGVDAPYLSTASVATLDAAGNSGAPSGFSFAGLPVIGFMARSFSNSTAGAGSCDVVPCNYNASFGHKFKRRQETAVPASVAGRLTPTGWIDYVDSSN